MGSEMCIRDSSRLTLCNDYYHYSCSFIIRKILEQPEPKLQPVVLKDWEIHRVLHSRAGFASSCQKGRGKTGASVSRAGNLSSCLEGRGCTNLRATRAQAVASRHDSIGRTYPSLEGVILQDIPARIDLPSSLPVG